MNKKPRRGKKQDDNMLQESIDRVIVAAKDWRCVYGKVSTITEAADADENLSAAVDMYVACDHFYGKRKS